VGNPIYSHKDTISNGRCIEALRKLNIIIMHNYNAPTMQMSSQQVVNDVILKRTIETSKVKLTT
jgi:hypothetical protein